MKFKFILAILITATVLLEAVSIYLSNTVAGSSIEVAQIKQKIEALNEKNMSLRSDLLGYSSFERIASRAAQLGFVESKDTLMLSAPLPVAVVH